MASRMDRYNRTELISSGRSEKNQNLYDQIKNYDTYSNLEEIATIQNSNELDIAKIKEMLKNRESSKIKKDLEDIMSKSGQPSVKDDESNNEEEKKYDINDILSKVKKDTQNSVKPYRSLNEEHYKELKNIKKTHKNYDEEEKDELKDLINTLTAMNALNKEEVLDDDVGLLDELKSDTMVGEAESIKKIIEEEKKSGNVEPKEEIDKSFYTSSFGFTSKDFEDLKDMNSEIKSDNKFIIILLILLIILVAVIIGVIFLPKLF